MMSGWQSKQQSMARCCVHSSYSQIWSCSDWCFESDLLILKSQLFHRSPPGISDLGLIRLGDLVIQSMGDKALYEINVSANRDLFHKARGRIARGFEPRMDGEWIKLKVLAPGVDVKESERLCVGCFVMDQASSRKANPTPLMVWMTRSDFTSSSFLRR